MRKKKRSKRVAAFEKKKGNVARVFTPEARLKRNIRAHFTRLGFTKASDGALVLPGEGKDVVRKLHSSQRSERLEISAPFLKGVLPNALKSFAHGKEVDPTKINFRLVRVRSGTHEADLFRVASLTWSVPVSVGFGRRLRYLVWDDHHNRLVGLIALGDPVFNLSVRDDLIGWDTDDRAKRLVNILDAYVLGAVPPYNMLLCGKAVACLVRSKEVYDDFIATYGGTVGIISGELKQARLLAVTTSSSMGRSSLYNRLRLDKQTYFESIGYTIGWGHFHIPDRLFTEIRSYLRLKKHKYAQNHQFGDGPNWRLRAIREALDQLGINKAVLKHGVKREVFISPFGPNALQILKEGEGTLDLATLKSVQQISDLAKDRWIVPRAQRRPEFQLWDSEKISNLIKGTPVSTPEKVIEAR